MHLLGKKGNTIVLAASLALGSLATPVSADHGGANLAPLAAFIAFGALLHHGRHHGHSHYYRHEYRHGPRRHHSPYRHSYSRGGYAHPRKHAHSGRYWHPGKRHHRKHKR